MSVNYLTGSEKPTAALMNSLFDALDAKLTTLLGGRSFFLAQTAAMPQYLCGKAFFFTSGPAVYAPRVPGYIETNTSNKPIARPYNHAQFVSAQATATFQPGYLKSATIQQAGVNYILNDVLTVAGGTVAPGGQPASVQVTQRDAATGKILAFSIVNAGSYSVLPQTPNQVNGGHGSGAWLDLNLFQFDLYNKVAPINRIDSPGTSTPHYSGLPYTSDVGLFEWSLAAHSVMYQGRGDKKPVRYYLQDGSTMPEKHFRFALAEIIIEGPLAVTIEKSWDKYACFRIHNLNPKPATLTFADGNYVVNLTPFQCVTVRRDWNGDQNKYENYRRGGNYFFKFEGGDPRFYWFFPSAYQNLSGTVIGYGGRAANSMQANNLVNPAILYDWLIYFQRNADGAATFAGWNEDATVQCDIYPLLKKLFGDPSDNATLVGDLIHHKGDIVILRKPKKIYQLAHAVVQSGGKGYAANDVLVLVGGTAVRAATVQILAVDAVGGVTAVAVLDGGGYAYPNGAPPSLNQVTALPSINGGNGSGAILSVQFNVVANGINSPVSVYGTKDKVTFNGYASIIADFAAKKLTVAENAAGNLVISNADLYNDVYLLPTGTNLFKTGEVVPAMVDLSGTNTFTIENAIFDPDPENPQLSSTTLATSGPQLITQPTPTIAAPTKTWTDIYDIITTPAGSGTASPNPDYTYAGSDGVYNYFSRNPQTQSGTLQTTLNWNTSVRGLLTTPTILDGGSGYQVGDVEQLTGGSGDAATVVVTAEKNGRVTGIRIGYAGNYITAPDNPNMPTAIYPDSRQGSGLRLGGISIPIKTMAGIHKTTVADLLRLDWWGDPRAGDQNSAYVSCSNRKLMFTPQGLVLTFTETDSPLPGDSALQPATLASYASGKRGTPRDRQIRFRAHGWGFVGVASGAFPPSGSTGIFSPTQGRQSATGVYRGEVVAPNGYDFYTDGWAFSEPSPITLLTRVRVLPEYAYLQNDGRFWKIRGDAIWGFVFPSGSTSYAQATAYGNVVIYNGSTSNLPVMAMPLVVEMYNALARAVNSVKTGVPLMWQCLYFNVGGYVVNLDPTCAFNLVRAGDNANVTWLSGYPFPQLDSSGKFVSGNSGYQYMYYNGPKPINQFAAFDQASLYERLCKQVGIPVMTDNDFPGGDDGNGIGVGFGYYKNQYSCPAVYCDFLEATGGVTAVPYALNPSSPPSGAVSGHYDKIANINVAITAQFTNTLQSELLSVRALIEGKPTGSRCIGTYDPTQAVIAPGSIGFPGFPQPVPYPFTTSQPGYYFVANDGSGLICLMDDNGGVRVVNPFSEPTNPGTNGNQFALCPPPNGPVSGVLQAQWSGTASYTSPKGIASYPGSELNYVHGYGMYGGVNLNAFVAYRWVQVEDIRICVEKYGFPFFWRELCTPLALRYFEEPTEQRIVDGHSTVSQTVTASFAGESGTMTYTFGDGSTVSYPVYSPQPTDLSSTRKTVRALLFGNTGFVGHGTLIKFCPTTDARLAKWKIAPVGAPTQAGYDAPTGTLVNGRLYGVPVEICNVKSRISRSPLFRYVSLGCMIVPSSGGNDWWAFWQSPSEIVYSGDYLRQIQGKTFVPAVKPSDANDFPRLVIQYTPKTVKVGKVDKTDERFTDLISTNYNEGVLLDQVQVLGINIYSSQPISPLPVLLSGQPVWLKQKDWWGNLNNGYAAGNYYNPSQNIPWQFVSPAASFVVNVTDYFGPAGQNGLTILSAAADERYWCCFSAAYFDLEAITFATIL